MVVGEDGPNRIFEDALLDRLVGIGIRSSKRCGFDQIRV